MCETETHYIIGQEWAQGESLTSVKSRVQPHVSVGEPPPVPRLAYCRAC